MNQRWMKYLKEMGIYNKLYEKFSRTGCYLCPKQNLTSWKAIHDHYPEHWQRAKEMEWEAKEKGCVIQTWRTDCSLDELEIRFQRDQKQGSFSFDWNEENVSCFCK